MEPVADAAADDPVDRLILQLRAYVVAKRKPRSDKRGDRSWTSGISITFDTETATDPSQRLRFGAFQVRDQGALIVSGLFHADDASADDIRDLQAAFADLRPSDAIERLQFLSRAEFVERIIYDWGLNVGALVVGFNLPFDLSRIAVASTHAKGSMKGGFSFTLAERRPSLRVKHVSQRSAFINFAGRNGEDHHPDRGFFVDVKTLAAALTGQSHSLESLAALLGTTPKSPLDSYEGPITREMVAYCRNDVQATWECFAVLAQRYGDLGLSKTGLHELYSEASLGKAYLQAMGIQPWTDIQPDFPPELIGQIMSTYYGGRAEVHIRREIVPVIHCDFLSMYPTVCTLMGLWRFVVAEGMDAIDATEEVRAFVEHCDLDGLRDQSTWRQLHAIVRVKPNDDIFPVRAQYEPDQPATIGVNRLTSPEPMWFTLADVLAAKLLGGKAPEIVSALRFVPRKAQSSLLPIMLAGTTVKPAEDDFYALLINQRRRIQAQEDAAPESAKAALGAAQQGLKILANSTSYGIFVELNVRQLDRSRCVTCYDFRGVGRQLSVSKLEDPGRYFHPLLGSLITGAARLMLALAERNALDQGLDWAFCDTDSLAIANRNNLPPEEFKQRVQTVLRYFEPLNPYDADGSILQLEKVNFPAGRHRELEVLRPVNCLAISAKRYTLFDRDESGAPVIRKASRHGLGHLLPPYKDPDPKRVGRLGVQLWQEDLWREIIRAHDRGRPEKPDVEALPAFGQPAASRYAVTNQTLLAWFKGYNAARPEAERVRPFNFLLTYQAKSFAEMNRVDPDALHTSQWRRRTPKPASRYSSDLARDWPEAFDRVTGEAIPREWLRTYHRTLNRHHLHSEFKFRGGEDASHGTLLRRHVQLWAVVPIGKEADNLDEREAIGEGDDPLIWEGALVGRDGLLAGIEKTLSDYNISDTVLTGRARVARRTLAAFREGRQISLRSLLAVAEAAEQLRLEAIRASAVASDWLGFARKLKDRLGSGNKLADALGLSRPYVHRVLNERKPLSDEMAARLRNWRSSSDEDPLL